MPPSATTQHPPELPTASEPFCGLLFAKLAQLARVRIGRALERSRLRPAEFALLHALEAHGPASQLALSRHLRIHPSNLVAILDRLERRRLVERGRDPRDRRQHLVGLTPAGARLLDRAREAVEEAERELLDPLSPAERRRLHELLETVASHGARCMPHC